MSPALFWYCLAGFFLLLTTWFWFESRRDEDYIWWVLQAGAMGLATVGAFWIGTITLLGS